MIVVTITIGILVAAFAATISIWFLEFGALASFAIAIGSGSIATFLLVLRALRAAECDETKNEIEFSSRNGVRKT